MVAMTEHSMRTIVDSTATAGCGTGIVLARDASMERTADPDSYASDFPTWEPRPDDVYTSDGMRVDGIKAIRRSDTGAILGTVGDGYVIRSHAQLAADLDALAAPFGGRRTLGPAKVISKGARITAIAALPREFETLLSVKGDKRGASLILRDARDGTLRESALVAIVRFACSNGLVRLGQSQLVASAKHTSAIAWLPSKLSAWSHEVESDLRKTGDRMHALSARRITADDVRTFARAVGNPDNADKGQQKAREEKIIDLVLGANGTWVPSIAEGMTALHLLESATAYDRHVAVPCRSKDPAEIAFRRIEKLSEGETLGARAWDWLSGFAGGVMA